MSFVMNLKIEFHMHKQAEQGSDEKGDDSEEMLSTYLEKELHRLVACRAESTMTNYRTAVRALMVYLEHDVPLKAVDAVIIGGFERRLREQGICLNTISCYMRSLRSLLGEPLRGAFGSVYTGNARTEKRSLSLDCISRLRNLTLQEGCFDALARDVFLFSFYAMGMPFVDVANLRHHQLSADALVYHRQKTGQRIVVPLEPPLLDIIARYDGQGADHRIFPLLEHGNMREYQLVLARYNRALRRLALKAGIGKKLTSYVARHSWASAAYGQNVDLSVISHALGHTNPNTTLVYIREIDDQRVKEANELIINSIGNATDNTPNEET